MAKGNEEKKKNKKENTIKIVFQKVRLKNCEKNFTVIISLPPRSFLFHFRRILGQGFSKCSYALLNSRVKNSSSRSKKVDQTNYSIKLLSGFELSTQNLTQNTPQKFWSEQKPVRPVICVILFRLFWLLRQILAKLLKIPLKRLRIFHAELVQEYVKKFIAKTMAFPALKSCYSDKF